MAGLGARTEFDDLEDELLKWVTEWDEANDALYVVARASYIKLARLKREKMALLTRIATRDHNATRSEISCRTSFKVAKKLVWHAHVHSRWGRARVQTSMARPRSL